MGDSVPRLSTVRYRRVQRTMEAVLLGLDICFMAQKAQAEYLKDCVSQIEQFEK